MIGTLFSISRRNTRVVCSVRNCVAQQSPLNSLARVCVCSSEDGLHWLPTIPDVVDEVQSRDADTGEAQGAVVMPANLGLGKRRANMAAFAAGDATEVQTDRPWAL